MSVSLNHTIVAAGDAETSARWFADLFGVAAPEPFGHFWQISTANDVGLDFASAGDREIVPQHYAFLVSEDDFDAIYGRVVEAGSITGPIHSSGSPARSTTTTAVAASTSRAPRVTSWRSSPGPTAVAADIWAGSVPGRGSSRNPRRSPPRRPVGTPNPTRYRGQYRPCTLTVRPMRSGFQIGPSAPRRPSQSTKASWLATARRAQPLLRGSVGTLLAPWIA